ncbi:MAG TPA: sugar-binding transcriptional regulator [Acetobacteraceae bacterium]|nr:sugar-binding transcriptional regulator [Acetobacteraceae bacterium]
MSAERRRQQTARQEQAARAAWLYYIAGRTQDEIATQLNISRQAAQRLVSRAVAEKLIKFRFDHPIGPCMELSRALTERYALGFCDVVPHTGPGDDPLPGIAIAGAQYLERWFGQRAPLVIGLSTGRTLRAIAAEVSPVEAPQHKVLSLCGTISQTGRAITTDPVMRLAERTGAQCFPMPAPVVASSIEERRLLHMQRSFQVLRDLAEQARCVMLGVGHIGWLSPLHQDGFVSDLELTELIEAGAVGEIAGQCFDARGRMVQSSVSERVAGLKLPANPRCIRVGVAGGSAKVAPLHAALIGRLINGLITDEVTATRLLQEHPAS